MIKVEAESIEEALIIAAKELKCSVANVDYEIVKHPRAGFFGFGKRGAQIVAVALNTDSNPLSAKESNSECGAKFVNAIGAVSTLNHDLEATQNRALKQAKEHDTRRDFAKLRASETFENPSQETRHVVRQDLSHGESYAKNTREYACARGCVSGMQKDVAQNLDISIETSTLNNTKSVDSLIVDNFFQPKDSTLEAIAFEVEEEINELFSHLPFKIERIHVRPYDDNTLFIEFKGEDSALLIGKEGYRYKALSYLLFNWINGRYGLMIRLEIAEFLQNQEEMVRSYLVSVIEGIKSSGRGQTRVLDGVLAHIALKQLREAFPDKYVSFRTNSDNERYVIVNDFNRS